VPETTHEVPSVSTLRTFAIVGVAAGFGAACLDGTAPRSSDVSAVVFGRILTTSGMAVPGADAVVEFLSDTTRFPGHEPECAGERILSAVTQPLDQAGDYRVELTGPAQAGLRVCVQVTGDPHGLYSDVGLRVAYGGWVTLRAANGVTARDSLRVDVRYHEMP